LKRLSPRIILAFDGDMAGEKAARRSTELGLSLGMEVKVANLPVGKDPADIIQEDSSEWKKILRDSVPAIEYFLARILEREKDGRKVGKLIEGNLLPLVAMVESAIERSHYVGLIAKRTGIKEEMLWEDLRRTKMPEVERRGEVRDDTGKIVKYPRKTNIERRLLGIIFWQESLPHPDVDIASLKGEIAKRVGQEYFEKLVTLLEVEKEVLIFEAESYYASAEKLSGDIVELLDNLYDDVLRGRLARLLAELSHAEMVKDQELSSRLSQEIQVLHKEMMVLEDVRKKM
jgi:DNA primase